MIFDDKPDKVRRSLLLACSVTIFFSEIRLVSGVPTDWFRVGSELYSETSPNIVTFLSGMIFYFGIRHIINVIAKSQQSAADFAKLEDTVKKHQELSQMFENAFQHLKMFNEDRVSFLGRLDEALAKTAIIEVDLHPALEKFARHSELWKKVAMDNYRQISGEASVDSDSFTGLEATIGSDELTNIVTKINNVREAYEDLSHAPFSLEDLKRSLNFGEIDLTASASQAAFKWKKWDQFYIADIIVPSFIVSFSLCAAYYHLRPFLAAFFS